MGDCLKSKINYYLEVDGMFKRAAANIFDVQNNPYEAILQLQAIQYDDSDMKKIEDQLLLAELWFDMNDSTNAETYVNRVSHIMHNTSDKEL